MDSSPWFGFPLAPGFDEDPYDEFTAKFSAPWQLLIDSRLVGLDGQQAPQPGTMRWPWTNRDFVQQCIWAFFYQRSHGTLPVSASFPFNQPRKGTIALVAPLSASAFQLNHELARTVLAAFQGKPKGQSPFLGCPIFRHVQINSTCCFSEKVVSPPHSQ